MNKVHHFCFHTDISSDECLTFQQAMKQVDRMLFVADMEKYINAQEEGNHWTIFQISSVPETVKTIKSIQYFERKREPDGELLNNKSQICTHDGMQ